MDGVFYSDREHDQALMNHQSPPSFFFFSILFHGTSINIYTRLGGNSPRNTTTCVITSCGNLFTWKNVHYKYTVREWRQNVLQNLLPFGNNLKKRLLHLSLSLLTDGLRKCCCQETREREKERDRERFS